MRCLRRDAVNLRHEVSGAVAVEYGLIAALIIVAIVGSIIQLGDALLALPLQLLADAMS